MCVLRQVAEELQSGPMSTEEKELLHLLTSPHLKVKKKKKDHVGDIALAYINVAIFLPASHFICPDIKM